MTHPFSMLHSLRRAALGTALVLGAAALAPLHAQMVERFDADPLTGQSRNLFVVEGDVASRFTFLAGEPSHFPGDHDGTFRVVYDTLLPTARLSTPLGQVLSLDADFDFGAILTIRSDGYFADPNGFSQIAFGLWNAARTGLLRTSFPSDSFDLVEIDYFPNVTSFGGPFLSPTVFGGNVADNAFFNFSFGSTGVTLPLDTPLLVEAHYDAALRRLDVTVSRHARALAFETIEGAGVSVDLSRIDPTFHVNVAGIAGYFEGYSSIHAVVDYDLLFTGPLPKPWSVTRRDRQAVGR
jgi:hypothetical protein